jgi:hypothetical protein
MKKDVNVTLKVRINHHWFYEDDRIPCYLGLMRSRQDPEDKILVPGNFILQRICLQGNSTHRVAYTNELPRFKVDINSLSQTCKK